MRRRAKPPPPPPPPDRAGGDGVLGTMVSGDLFAWVRRVDERPLLCYPAGDLAKHAAVVGAAGSGKTETLLRLAHLARAVYGWRVFFLDAKGDPGTRDRFLAAMAAAGVAPGRMRAFPGHRYDAWRGDGRALVNRLMEVSDFSEPYYREIALRVLDLAASAPPGPPRSSRELLSRLRKPALRLAYRGRPDAAEVDELVERDVAGVANRYRAFFGAVGGGLDGSFAFDDVDAAYLLLEGLALKEEAARLGRFFLEDFAHYAASRKPPDEAVLLIVDEFSALEASANAAHLFERLRSFGAAVVVSSQSYAGLGAGADRILDACRTLILHASANPEPLVARAGTVRRMAHTIQIDPQAGPRGGHGITGKGTVTREHVFRVPPDDVRQLEAGQAFVIAGGRAAKVRILRLELPDSDAIALPPPDPPSPSPAPAKSIPHVPGI
jgi:hypothetical protein